MQKLRFLASREAKQMLDRIQEQWGAELHHMLGSFGLAMSSQEKVYMINKDFAKLDAQKLRIDSLGMYFAEVKGGSLRLSIEGAQLVGPRATKNVAELNEQELQQWLRGEDLEKKGDWQNFVIVAYNKDFVGSGKYKEGIIYNFVPKIRRVKELII